jgi:hypothetical protein
LINTVTRLVEGRVCAVATVDGVKESYINKC